jgi:hypothetical protein
MLYSAKITRDETGMFDMMIQKEFQKAFSIVRPTDVQDVHKIHMCVRARICVVLLFRSRVHRQHMEVLSFCPATLYCCVNKLAMFLAGSLFLQRKLRPSYSRESSTGNFLLNSRLLLFELTHKEMYV